MNKYTELNGTSYDEGTSLEVMRVLEYARINQTRIKLDLGDTDTLTSWNEACDTVGYVGRSTGKNKVPILVYNERSMGGGAILTKCILAISHANKKNGGYLYKKAGYKIREK